jgi:thioredoxin 1
MTPILRLALVLSLAGAASWAAAAAGEAETKKVAEPKKIASAEDFKTSVEEAKGLVFVDFYADWCGWCKKLAPIVDKLAAAYDGKVAFVKVDTEALKDLAERYKVDGLPTMMVFKDGKAAKTIVGYKDEAALKKILDKLLEGDEKK